MVSTLLTRFPLCLFEISSNQKLLYYFRFVLMCRSCKKLLTSALAWHAFIATLKVVESFALLRWRIVAFGARGTGHEYR